MTSESIFNPLNGNFSQICPKFFFFSFLYQNSMLQFVLTFSSAFSAFAPEHWAGVDEVLKAAPRGYAPTPPGVPIEFECAWRNYAYEYGQAINDNVDKLELFNALMLASLCNKTAPASAAAATSHTTSYTPNAANTIYVATDGNDANPGTTAEKPKRTVAAGVVASRAFGAGPKTVSIAAGTYYLAATVELAAADSDLTIEGNGKVWLSGAQALPSDLKWTQYKVQPAQTGVLNALAGQNNQHGCLSNGTSGACTCHYEPVAATCMAACQALGSTACKSYAWSGVGSIATVDDGWANQCCLRSDETWNPVSQSAHTSGKWMGALPAINSWKTVLSPSAAKTMDGSYPAQLRVGADAASEVMRAPRARHPNANPETDLFPKGWNSDSGVSWLPPRPYKTKLQIVGPINNSEINERGTSTFLNYGGGINGPCEVFSPPFSYWCQAHPQGGGGFQYFVPSGFEYPATALPQFNATAKPLSALSGWTVQMWRRSHWANWMFDVDAIDTTSNTMTLGRGGYQGCRGGNGSDWYVEGDLAFLDAAGEFLWDKPTSTLYYAFNGTAKPTGKEIFSVPTIQTLLRLNGTQAAPVKDVRITNIGFRDAAPTYMEPHAVPSGGDWALERTAALFATGTTGLTVSKCSFYRNDGNGCVSLSLSLSSFSLSFSSQLACSHSRTHSFTLSLTHTHTLSLSLSRSPL